MPRAEILYSCDAKWWQHSGPTAAEFTGERWSSHNLCTRINDNKTAAAASFGLNLIDGFEAPGFCADLGRIHYGNNSGFQAINLAMQFGATEIWLIGFDMHTHRGRHFFGDHPPQLQNASPFATYIPAFEAAARMLPPDVRIINATPGTALQCFERGTL